MNATRDDESSARRRWIESQQEDTWDFDMDVLAYLVMYLGIGAIIGLLVWG